MAAAMGGYQAILFTPDPKEPKPDGRKNIAAARQRHLPGRHRPPQGRHRRRLVTACARSRRTRSRRASTSRRSCPGDARCLARGSGRADVEVPLRAGWSLNDGDFGMLAMPARSETLELARLQVSDPGGWQPRAGPSRRDGRIDAAGCGDGRAGRAPAGRGCDVAAHRRLQRRRHRSSGARRTPTVWRCSAAARRRRIMPRPCWRSAHQARADSWPRSGAGGKTGDASLRTRLGVAAVVGPDPAFSARGRRSSAPRPMRASALFEADDVHPAGAYQRHRRLSSRHVRIAGRAAPATPPSSWTAWRRWRGKRAIFWRRSARPKGDGAYPRHRRIGGRSRCHAARGAHGLQSGGQCGTGPLCRRRDPQACSAAG